jgi:outer membrane protein assembly factor BamE (lipoprotein component of BamABCDE complex)
MSLIATHKLTVISLLMLLLTACAINSPRLTHDNFAQVREGMSEHQVIALLGEPTDSRNASTGAWFGVIGGVSGTMMIWETKDAKADIIFVNGKVRSKTYKKYGL